MKLEEFRERYVELKSASGTHSPSIKSIENNIAIDIKVDACFLSNPYATGLFMERLTDEVMNTGKLEKILEYYPSQNRDIASRLSSMLCVNKENIFIGNGAIEIIQAVLEKIVKNKLLLLIPTFSSYYEFTRPDTDIFYFNYREENETAISIDGIIAKIQEDNISDLVLINPNNPDGLYITYQNVRQILLKCPQLNSLILDESFVHFAYENTEMDPVIYEALVLEFPNLILIKSMSKDFGIAGIRAGYAVMDSERVNFLLQRGYLWNSSGLADYFFDLYSRRDFQVDYEVVRKKYIMNTLMFFNSLNELKNCRMVPSKANFALLELKTKTSSDVFTELIYHHGVYVRDCSDKIGLNGEFIRVASRTFEENLTILQALKQVIG